VWAIARMARHLRIDWAVVALMVVLGTLFTCISLAVVHVCDTMP